ncbi:MAG: hypothetical protein E6J43_13660 [Chloroflexi bacterium]|nr:MAG: hypothetical protein E6J43_13660 [Chloroflexota bacterium]
MNVKVATLNLKKGELRWGERAPLLMEQMVELRPDIIGIQEVDLRLDQGNWLCRRFNDLACPQDAPEYTIHHMGNPRHNIALEAIAVMTRLPVLAHDGLDYLVRERVAHRLTVDVGGGVLDFYNTHFHHLQDEAGHEMRRAQAEKLLRWMDTHGWQQPKVLVGDFNAPPGTRPIRIIEERLQSAHKLAHGVEPHHTLTPLASILVGNEPPEGYVVDYIFVSPSVRVREASIVFDRTHPNDSTLYASDHLGLLASVDVS